MRKDGERAPPPIQKDRCILHSMKQSITGSYSFDVSIIAFSTYDAVSIDS